MILFEIVVAAIAGANETAAQKKFDEFVAKLKCESPINSDWKRELRNKIA